jgi:amino acid adenylation domain-containing protein
LGGTAMSYDALNRRANQIARHLRGAGAAPGVLVGICMERCADLLATLLAVLKTGAAYVPLDPDFPAARLDFMAEHSGLELLVLNTGAPGNVQPGDKWPPAVHAGRAFAARIIDLGADAETLDACDDGDLGITPAGADPAYVIYTSGSTGRPNGVVVSHAALSNFLGAMLGEPGLSGADILAAVTTVSFDIAGLELYLPLLAGACVVIVPREVASDGVALAGLLEEERVTVMQATPATWRLLIEARWAGGATFTALCGGEPLPEDLARSLRKRVGALWNMYGPTETTIWSTCGRFEPAEGQITIGRPIANTSIFIVDESGQPTPVGVPGELWIGGAGLASGYWRNPALTEAKFRPDPFHANDPSGSAPAREPAQRIYRTGDLVRWLPDGRIVHMGRLDRQVKLRGFRIEPGEIETALTAHDAVREAIVVCQGDSPDRQRLVAYVVYHPGRDLTTSEVRAHVRLSLPGYMIPSAFVSLDSVPRLPNGKVDRRALPDPFRQGSMASSVYVQPAPGAEEVIARIWADILKVDRVGADDNFFDLGGHSLLSLRAAAAVREQTGWPMPARAMFFKTLSQIAASLQSHEAEMRGAK